MSERHRLSTLEELLKLIRQMPERMLSEEVDIEDTLMRVVGHDLYAPEDLPHFCRAAVDGYALSAIGTRGLSMNRPLLLTLVGGVTKGEMVKTPLVEGTVVKTLAGAMLPPGADSVILPETVDVVDEEHVRIYRPVNPGENVIPVGSDLRSGVLVLPKGHQLRPQDVGILAGLGFDRLYVASRPKVGIISTGDELAKIGDDLKPGTIRDLNTYTLSALVKCNGGMPVSLGIIRDSKLKVKESIQLALQHNELVLLSGASSDKNRAELLEMLSEMGEIYCANLAVKPGQSTIAARIGQKMVFCLPGHPVSTMIIFEVLVKPYLQHIMNYRERETYRVRARISCSIASLPEYDEFFRVKLENRNGEYWATPIAGESALISTLVQADGLIKIPHNKEGINLGEVVEVIGLSGGYL